MTIIEILSLTVTVISVVSFLAVLVYYRFFRKNTREKFAFFVFTSISTLSFTVIALIFNGNSVISQLVSIVAGLAGQDTTAYTPGISDKILAIIVIFTLATLAIILHKNWPGQISTREYESKLSGIKPGVITGTMAAIADYTGKAPLQVYSGSSRRWNSSEFLPPISETKSWGIWVARLLHLSQKQIQINEDEDWYPERNLYIGKHGRKGAIAGVLCKRELPSQEEIENVINFIKSEEGIPTSLLIAIENGEGKTTSAHIDGVEVTFRYKEEMLDSLVDFSDYREQIRVRYEEAEVSEGFHFRLPDIYVPGSAYIPYGTEEEKVDNVDDYIHNWCSERSLRHLALLGEYGQGKSVLALRIAYRMLFEERAPSRTPILITLGGRSPRNQTKLSFLAEWAAPYGINPNALLALHESGRLILIFDGFDEMDLIGEASLRLDHFRTLWDFSRDRSAKILITGRPNFFLDQIEREASLNIRKESSDVPYTVPLYLQPFTMPQIKAALRNFDADVKKEIADFLNSPNASPSFCDLLARPSTLFQAANIWKEIRPSDPTIGIRSASVISTFIAHSYDRQQKKGHDSILSTLEREYFTVGAALGMLKESRFSNHIDAEKLRKIIGGLLERFPSDLTKYEPATGKAREPLKERLHDRSMLVDTVFADVRSCGILVTDLSQFDSFKFAHKSFFELLVATWACTTIVTDFDPKSKLLYKAASGEVGSELARLSTPVAMRMNREMCQFASDILYDLVMLKGAKPKTNPDAKFEKLGVPISRLRTAAKLLRSSVFYPMGLYLHILLLGRMPLSIYQILGNFYTAWGASEWDDFILLRKSTSKLVRNLLFSQMGPQEPLEQEMQPQSRRTQNTD